MTWRSVRRFLAGGSPIVFPVLAICVALLTGFRQSLPWATTAAAALILFAAGVWFFQAWSEYIRRTHDPTLILQYQDKWDAVVAQRKRAAGAFLEHWEHRSEIDKYEAEFDPSEDVLDILEDVGFYIDAEQISPVVAHHHLYHWIQVWWFAARPYVEAHQLEDPARWDHLASLYAETSAIEKRQVGKHLRQRGNVDWRDVAPPDEAKLKQFLEEERDLPTDDSESTRAGAAAK